MSTESYLPLQSTGDKAHSEGNLLKGNSLSRGSLPANPATGIDSSSYQATTGATTSLHSPIIPPSTSAHPASKLRYALYARKSHGDHKLTEKSLKDQVDVWRDLAQERGYTIVRTYRESKSAKDPGQRPLYSDMLRRIKRGEFDSILTWHINRLARNMDEGGALAHMLISGIIKEIRTPHEVYRSGDNIIPLILQHAIATQNNLDHALAVRRGMNSRMQEGGWTHRAPVGYLNRRDESNPKKGVLATDPERFDMLRRAWQLLLTDCYSVAEIIDRLNDEWGFRTRQTDKRGGSKITRSHGYKIFSNIFYAGYIMYEGQLRKGSHRAMISVTEFNRAQTIIRQRSKPRTRREFIYRGLLRCGFCGQQATAEEHWKGSKRHVYYRCSDSFGTCTKKGINETNLEAQALRLFESITIDPQLCALALENIARWHGERSQGAEGIYAQLHQNVEAVENQLNNLLTLRLREVISDDTLYQKKEAELIAERNRLRLAIAEAEQELERVRETASRGYHFTAFARDTFLAGDTEAKRELARALGLSYILKANELSIELDPLLVELVKFADEIIVQFEPGLKGSQSRYRASFSSRKSFGRAKGTLFEPGAMLRKLLREHSFYNFGARSKMPEPRLESR